VLRFRFSVALALVAGAAVAQTSGRPAEKVRVTYDASSGCPGSNAFLEQVRARVGAGWEAPPNELARTIEVRVTVGDERSVARIDFVDENNQPISRVVTAKTCDEVVTGIALVTALAIESRIAEAVGKSEPATATAAPAASELPAAQRAPEEPKVTPAPAPVPVQTPREESGPPPHYDFGGGVIASAGALPGITFGFRGFVGVGWRGGPDLRIGGEFSNTGSVQSTVNGNTYDSKFSLALGRASMCPLAFGEALRFLPCAGIEIGSISAKGFDASRSGLQVEGGEASGVWVAPFASLRADVTWEIFFAEAELSLAFPVLPPKRDFVFQRTPARGAPPTEDKVHTIWPVSPGLALTVGLRL
jgi:hypothetical protein